MNRTIVLAVIALAVGAAACEPMEPQSRAAADLSSSAAPAAATTSAAAAPATTTASPKPTPAAKPVKYSGRGDKILSVKKPAGEEIGYAEVSHSGSSNFMVETVETQDLLINTIGSYKGRVMFDVEDGSDTKRLKITADGSWSVTLLPLSSLRRFDTNIAGKGDDVVVYLGDDSATAAITHRGEANFMVETFGDDSDLLVNEIGDYSGEQLLSTSSLVKITADGAWTIKITS